MQCSSTTNYEYVGYLADNKSATGQNLIVIRLWKTSWWQRPESRVDNNEDAADLIQWSITQRLGDTPLHHGILLLLEYVPQGYGWYAYAVT